MGKTCWFDFPGTYALMARRYFHEFNSSHDDLVHISVKNHYHGLDNEVAHIRKDVSFDKAKSGFMVADPLTLYDCCPTSDGASCVILAADHVVNNLPKTLFGLTHHLQHLITWHYMTDPQLLNYWQHKLPLRRLILWPI